MQIEFESFHNIDKNIFKYFIEINKLTVNIIKYLYIIILNITNYIKIYNK